MSEGDDHGPETPAEAPVEASDLKSISSQTAYESFLSAAKAVEPGFIEECCTDIVLTYQSVTHAVEQVLGSGAASVARLPHVNVVELSMLPRLVQGLAHAALQVEREFVATSFGKQFLRAQHLRRKLRKAADALAEAQLLPAEDIDEVWLYARQDLLEDSQSLVELFRRNAVRLSGRSPVVASDLQEAEQLVAKLRTALGVTGGTPEGESLSVLRAVEMRDRFWTLVNQRYDLLWRCGAWLFGRAVHERVPPLPTRMRVVYRERPAPSERELVRAGNEPPRGARAPAASLRVTPPPSGAGAARDSSRHLGDLQRTLERKARFLVRIGVVPSSR